MNKSKAIEESNSDSISVKRNYHKESNYAAQKKYCAAHYKYISLKLPIATKSVLDSIAQERGVSLNRLIKEAIQQVYDVDCFIQK